MPISKCGGCGKGNEKGREEDQGLFRARHAYPTNFVEMDDARGDRRSKEKQGVPIHGKEGQKGKIVRKSYLEDTRKLIYLNAGGHCELCGRKILLSDMTIDHVKPLAMGGEDDVANLACTCYPCNLFKGNIQPSDFLERITDIFMYQMERRHKGMVGWKIIYRVLKRII